MTDNDNDHLTFHISTDNGISATVSEPSIVALLGLGLAGLVVARRKA